MIGKMKITNPFRILSSYVIVLCFIVFSSSFPLSHATMDGTITFPSWLRPSHAFDVYSLPISGPPNEIRLTDGVSKNYNGHFPSPTSIVSMQLPLMQNTSSLSTITGISPIIYVTERFGSSSIYMDLVSDIPFVQSGTRSILDVSGDTDDRVQVLLVGDEQSGGRVSMKDRPSLVGESLIYVSTHEDPGKPRDSWTAVYSTHMKTGLTRRLTPKGVADFSPAVSPSGMWTAVASYGEKGWQGEYEELGTNIYVFLTRDGSKRVRIIEHGGWPSWADDSTLYFHRKCDDGWWSVFRASFVVENGIIGVDSVVTRRVTPPGLHAFTPAASVANKSLIAIATRRSGSEFRHIELYDVVSSSFIELTNPVSPNAHHFNPFVSPDSTRVGYHRCRGATNDVKAANDLLLESIRSPLPTISLFRVDGSYPSYSPDGDRIAYVKLPTEPMAFVEQPGLFVMNSDGTGVRNVLNRTAFSTAWDWKRTGIVYASVGPIFGRVGSKVDIISINVDDENLSYKTLTIADGNHAFPSPSPDGEWVVFRSGRSGHKNLYIMDALNGEMGELYRLTKGPWTDTMCNWSPDGEWIVFSSDREDPGAGSFALFKIHPNGTGLRKVFQSGSGGRVMHPWFSRDGKYIVVTSDYAGVSAEPIANPFQYQPGNIFVMKADGSEIRRVTHNAYEDGTPTWTPRFVEPANVEWPNNGRLCSFSDFPSLDTSLNQGSSGSLTRHCAR